MTGADSAAQIDTSRKHSHPKTSENIKTGRLKTFQTACPHCADLGVGTVSRPKAA
ncbi:hypothetical protein [Neisseria sp.]|uniref:hypothetical protein n=1 Tax=Neisseria sp. TaxID=192066 RepID=UPI0035A156E1